ncbi:MAG: hypothetical protein GF317_10245, partial [Candidatus Lokiarchaeota archaeon]|nr:hypothetical protein [Candidatus Lokiarchaeota archaeon]MBD3200040.1 hypothetical protein [Candidatus Lokiarchaeota archaeon]
MFKFRKKHYRFKIIIGVLSCIFFLSGLFCFITHINNNIVIFGDIDYDRGYSNPKCSAEDNYEDNDGLLSAYDLSNNESVWLSNINGQGYQGDDDVYMVYASYGSTHLTIELTFTESAGSMCVNIYNSMGSPRFFGALPSTDNYTLVWAHDGRGDYYIEVVGEDNGNAYDMIWYDNHNSVSDDNYEENDFDTEAYNISSNENTWLSNIDGYGQNFDVDVYEIYVGSIEQFLTLDSRFIHNEGDIDMALFNETMSLYLADSSTNNELIQYPLHKVGTYYIYLWGDGNGNAYNLKWDAIQDTNPPSWDEMPLDQTIEAGDSFYYDLNASDMSNIDSYWINNTVNFSVDSDGVITNITELSIGEYWLKVNVNDTYGNPINETIKITVQDTTPPTWDEPLENQSIDEKLSFLYDVNASDISGISSYWINDTFSFNIDSHGKLSNTTTLSLGIIWLEIRAYDPSNNYATDIIKITIRDITEPTWNETPTDQIFEYRNDFSFDVYASDFSGIDHYWINDAYFDID